MLSNVFVRRSFGLAAAALAACFCVHAASASQLRTLYSFCSLSNCTDGNEANSGAVRDSAGNIYVSTLSDGDSNGGDAVALTYAQGAYKYALMHRFCSETNCTDGETPVGNMIVDVDGNVYGVAREGGKHGGGAIFKLTPKNAKRTKWRLSLIYNFCVKANCTDGAYPFAGLTYQGQSSGLAYDGTSPLFGTASEAGGANGGVVFMLTPGKKNARQKVLYDFCSQASCADGAAPQGALALDASGNIYGTTNGGGAANSGTVFELSPNGGTYKQTVLYSFCRQANCADGTQPHDALVMDANGNLFSTTEQGGFNNHGVVFKVVPKGANSPETVLYTFCPGNSCGDGSDPVGTLSIGANGDIFGTTAKGGGSHPFGTIFRVRGTAESVLYDFCSEDDCADGAAPYGGIVLDSSGNMYGTTVTGGANDSGGTVFEFTP